MAVVSNSSFGEPVIRYELEKHGLTEHLAFVLVSSDYSVRKPNGLLFDTAAARLGVSPQHIWFVGDRLDTDVTGAKAAAWMTALHPLMGQRRREQIDRALASYEPRPCALLDDRSAHAALALLQAGSSVREVAGRYGVSVWCIYDLRSGRTHKHLARP